MWIMENNSAIQWNELSSHEKIWRNFKCLFLSERNQSQKAADYVIPITWHSGKEKTTETLKRSVVAQDEVVVEANRQSTEDFRSVKILCMILYTTMDGFHYTLPKPTECTTPRGSLNANDGSLVMVMCQCESVNCNKRHVWWGCW